MEPEDKALQKLQDMPLPDRIAAVAADVDSKPRKRTQIPADGTCRDVLGADIFAERNVMEYRASTPISRFSRPKT
jgi:hypothetical protein